MRKIDEVMAIPDIGERIEKLKLHRGKYHKVNTPVNISDWDPDLHEIMTDKAKYPDTNQIVKKGKTVLDSKTGQVKKMDDETEKILANRISLPMERDIVNMHTAFSVGMEPTLKMESDDDKEKTVLQALKYTFKKNYIKYKNKEEVRSLFSEQEVAEYWFMKEDNDGFWRKLWKRIKSSFGINSVKRPCCVVWSPFRGDKLYPFMEDDDMTGFLRQYKIRDSDNSEIECYMLVTDEWVFTWKLLSGTWVENKFQHNFGKIPVDYMWRRETLCSIVRSLRIRLEKVMSEYADCIDYHFFPYLLLFGEIEKWGGSRKNRVLQMMGEKPNAQYLTWNQVPETIKMEIDRLFEEIYSMTHTPRVSLDNIKGMQAPSGSAFKFFFMQILVEVANHEEIIGPFLQRRVNLVTTILGKVNSELQQPSLTADIETEMQPYMLDNISEKISKAVEACNGPIWDRATGIAFVGNIDNVDEVVNKLNEQLKEEEANGTAGASAPTRKKEDA